MPGILDKEFFFGGGAYLWEHTMEVNLPLDDLKPSQFHQMSRLHIILGLNFKPIPQGISNQSGQWKGKGKIRTCGR